MNKQPTYTLLQTNNANIQIMIICVASEKAVRDAEMLCTLKHWINNQYIHHSKPTLQMSRSWSWICNANDTAWHCRSFNIQARCPSQRWHVYLIYFKLIMKLLSRSSVIVIQPHKLFVWHCRSLNIQALLQIQELVVWHCRSFNIRARCPSQRWHIYTINFEYSKWKSLLSGIADHSTFGPAARLRGGHRHQAGAISQARATGLGPHHA